MPIDKVYHPAAVISALAYYLLGWLWYGAIFGGTWTRLANVSPGAMRASDPVPYIVAAATSLVLAYVVALVLDRSTKPSVAQGAALGLLLGVGLVASTMLENYLYEARPVSLWLINAGYVVVGMTMIGAIVGGWRKSAREL